jgi:hypothetical protein
VLRTANAISLGSVARAVKHKEEACEWSVPTERQLGSPGQFIRSDDTLPERHRLTSFVTTRAGKCQECLEFTALLLDNAGI